MPTTRPRRAPKRQRRLVVLSSEDEEEERNTAPGSASDYAEEETRGVKGDSAENYTAKKKERRETRASAVENAARGVKRRNNGALAVPSSSSSAAAESMGNAAATMTLPTRTQQAAGTQTAQAKPKLKLNPQTKTKQKQKQTQRSLFSLTPSPQRSRTRSIQSTPASSPEKKRAKVGRQEEPSKSLHSFFARATEEQRWARKKEPEMVTKGKKSMEREREREIVEEIEDEDEEFEELFTKHALGGAAVSTSASATAVGKAKLGDTYSQLDRRKGVKGGQGLAKPVKRFLLPPALGEAAEAVAGGMGERNGAAGSFSTQGMKPWAEEYAPVNLDELAVHKKKVADVQKWLVDVFAGRSRRRVLVLKGPAGSGKTTTVSLLSKALGFDIVEWKNPLGSEFSSQGYVSMGAQFEDFLGRSDKFGSLMLSGEQELSNANGEPSNAEETRRAILVEEFPSSLSQSSSGLKAFRHAIQSYLAMAVPPFGIAGRLTQRSVESSPPIIIIVSETLLGSGGISSDSFTVHRLLGPELSNHPGLNIIEFNRVAPTFIAKALDLVLKKEARRSKRKRIPGPEVLKAFTDMGDVRSAISGLEFLCLRGDDQAGWSGTVAGMKKSSKSGVPLTTMEKESLEMVTQREASLGIFHAVGKVVYNKREGPSTLPPPPQHLQHHVRPTGSQVSINELMNETGTDLQTFVAALHENYVLSCNGQSFVEHFDNCISNLSETDILGPGSRYNDANTSRGGIGSARSSYQGYGSSIDMLRQDEISFQVAVRGLLFSLPSPIKRQAPPGSRAGDAHKMFFPTSMRLWRQTEEMDGLLDLWMRRLTDPTTDISSGAVSRPEGVASWKNNRWASGAASHDDGHGSGGLGSSGPTRAMISRDEVLLDRLPYLALISRNASEIRGLEKITQFRGVGGQSVDPVDGDLLDDSAYDGGSGVEPWSTSTDRAGDGASPQKRRQWGKFQQGGSKSFGPRLVQPVEEAVEKLVLSDDDIEDD
ncbi:Cell cycle checkpoint protein rad17 [Onygenales sp. PD_12]|nr:Cell cycle checkpoint protein rad17 [Onygenales sp. PD_12]